MLPLLQWLLKLRLLLSYSVILCPQIPSVLLCKMYTITFLRGLPHPTIPVLNLVSQVAHDDVHSNVVEQEHPELQEMVEISKISDATVALSSQLVLDSQVAPVDVHSDVVEQKHPKSREMQKIPKVSDVAATLSSSVEHEDMHEIYVELVSSAFGREVSPVQTNQHVVAHDDVHSSSPAGPFIVWSIHDELVTITDVEWWSKEVATTTVTQAANANILVSAT